MSFEELPFWLSEQNNFIKFKSRCCLDASSKISVHSDMIHGEILFEDFKMVIAAAIKSDLAEIYMKHKGKHRDTFLSVIKEGSHLEIL